MSWIDDTLKSLATFTVPVVGPTILADRASKALMSKVGLDYPLLTPSDLGIGGGGPSDYKITDPTTLTGKAKQNTATSADIEALNVVIQSAKSNWVTNNIDNWTVDKPLPDMKAFASLSTWDSLNAQTKAEFAANPVFSHITKAYQAAQAKGAAGQADIQKLDTMITGGGIQDMFATAVQNQQAGVGGVGDTSAVAAQQQADHDEQVRQSELQFQRGAFMDFLGTVPEKIRGQVMMTALSDPTVQEMFFPKFAHTQFAGGGGSPMFSGPGGAGLGRPAPAAPSTLPPVNYDTTNQYGNSGQYWNPPGGTPIR